MTQLVPQDRKDVEPQVKGDAWAQQHHWQEGAKAYQAFLLYRGIHPPERTYRQAAELYRTHFKLKGTIATVQERIEEWGTRFRWRDRVQAFDAYMDAAEVAQMKKRRIEAARRHADQAAEVQAAMLHPVRLYNERLQSIIAGKSLDQLTMLTDEELIKLGRQTASILADFQKAEREALNIGSGIETGDTESVTVRAEVLRGVLARPDSVAMLERIGFEVAGQARKIEAGESNGDSPGQEVLPSKTSEEDEIEAEVSESRGPRI